MTTTTSRLGFSHRASRRLFSDGGDTPRPVSPVVVTNDNGDSVTITSRGVDAIGSSHRYVTVVDSNGDSYLVGFGDASDGCYLTSDGQWGDGSDLPGPTEYGSIQGAWYNDNTEGYYNLPLLQRLITAGVSFASTRLVLDIESPSVLFTPSYSCVDDILHVHNDSDLGWINSQYSFLDEDDEGPYCATAASAVRILRDRHGCRCTKLICWSMMAASPESMRVPGTL